jgi:hypothetical protein
MSMRRRVLGGGLALGLAISGLGLMRGFVEPADAACTPLGNYAVCAVSGSGPGYRSVGVAVGAAPNADPLTAAIVALCYGGNSLAVVYATNTSQQSVHLDALAPYIC